MNDGLKCERLEQHFVGASFLGILTIRKMHSLGEYATRHLLRRDS